VLSTYGSFKEVLELLVNYELERQGMKRSLPNLRYYPGIRLKGVRKIKKTLNLNNRCPGLDLHVVPPECASETPPFEPTCPVVGYVGEMSLPSQES
jgi:hypothetical protein